MKFSRSESQRSEAEAEDLTISQFRAFLGELASARKQLAAGACVSTEAAAQEMKRRMLGVLETQMLQAQRGSTCFDAETLADTRYLKAALTDEILLNANWAGRERWTSHLLESTLYQSNVAGDEVFQRIERLLAEREPARRAMARLYLFALAVGFQGRFRGADGQRKLHAYRDGLYEFAYQRRAEPADRDQVLSPVAYASTLSNMSAIKPPTFGRWTCIFLSVVVAVLAASEIAWLFQSWSVREALQVFTEI